MGARYDKYDPISGGFRAALAADLTVDSNGEFGPAGVSLNANGRVVVGNGGNSGLVGVMIKNVPELPAGVGVSAMVLDGIWEGVRAGDIVDVMTNGEIVDVEGLAAGSNVYVTPAGDLTTTSLNNFLVGFTVEADRLVIRMPLGAAASA